jgi:hypothetical protein
VSVSWKTSTSMHCKGDIGYHSNNRRWPGRSKHPVQKEPRGRQLIN